MSQTSVGRREMANAIRALSMDAVEAAGSGHPGMPMGMADVATALFTKHLVFDPAHADWPDRDRFVLSAGHGSMLLYSLLHLTGYPDMTMEELKNYRQLGSRTAGHPEYGHALGIETTTGPLGQGIGNGVGMALAERLLAARFGSDLVDHRTWVLAGDGCLMEGISHEAISLAGHLKLAKLTILFDDNRVTIDGPTSIAVSDDQVARFEAHRWHTISVDGHDFEAVDAAMEEARRSDRPTLIACRTTIGKGAPNKGGKSAAHGSPLGKDEIALVREALGWSAPPFEIPETIGAAWREAGGRGAARHDAWHARLQGAEAATRKAFEDAIAGRMPRDLEEKIDGLKAKIAQEKPKLATRKASQNALEILTAAVPEMVGGSADLTGSNNTNTKATPPVTADDFSGRYVNFGVREHAMVAAMNGMALHRGVIPYGGTFLTFSDYCRPSLRLAALMGIRVLFVATHDSIGLGGDGPTHQPIEHLASLRAMPNMKVFRPADAVETAECWLAALCNEDGPSTLALSRQNLPTLRTEHRRENLSARGAYVLEEAEGERAATIIATGSEVEVALAGRALLADAGIDVAVVSMPCQELFERQDPAYRSEVLGDAPRVAVEAGTPFGWTRYVASEEDVIGMRSFGASGEAEELFAHFGITAEKVAERVRALI
ncbi:MAG: transketolase [Geminicoccaceae bacterium]|nr:transketolase [Geminicoccaceae bacterium]